jgi:phosphoesterase RecJ-like protein
VERLLEVPASRAARLEKVVDRLRAASHVVLTTHVNADGDGTGSECAIAAWLDTLGVRATIVNPTPFPSTLRFLAFRPDLVQDLPGEGAVRALREADLFLVLDTSEPNRVEPLLPYLDPERTLVVDHHPAGPSVVGWGVQDPTASAAGELAFDVLRLAGGEFPAPSVLGIYVALVSDTGSFRFSNTTPRAHAIAADMLTRGVDPERVFQILYATLPLRRIELLREALGSLRHDPELGLSWMVIERAAAARLHATSEDFEGLIDHARAVEGTRVAILFRETPAGETKISFRSNGDADVNRVAREFGGGGHVKAAGALIPTPAARAVPAVLARVREVLGK